MGTINYQTSEVVTLGTAPEDFEYVKNDFCEANDVSPDKVSNRIRSDTIRCSCFNKRLRGDRMKRIFIEKESGRIFSEDEYKKFWEEESRDPNNHHYQQHFEDYVYEKCHEKNCPDIEAWTCDGTDELAMEIVRNLNYCNPVYSDFSKEEFDPFAILEDRPESRLTKLASACFQFETDLKTALNAFNEAKKKCL